MSRLSHTFVPMWLILKALQHNSSTCTCTRVQMMACEIDGNIIISIENGNLMFMLWMAIDLHSFTTQYCTNKWWSQCLWIKQKWWHNVGGGSSGGGDDLWHRGRIFTFRLRCVSVFVRIYLRVLVCYSTEMWFHLNSVVLVRVSNERKMLIVQHWENTTRQQCENRRSSRGHQKKKNWRVWEREKSH